MSKDHTDVGSLWPEQIGQISVRPPATVLKEQGEALARRTSGLVQGIVESGLAPLTRLEALAGQTATTLRHSFFLVATPINYRFQLLTVEHGPVPYPATIWVEELTTQYRCQ